MLTQGDLFSQMLAIEENSGIYPYSAEELLECLVCTDTWLLMDEGTVAGFISIDPRCTDYEDISLHIGNLNIAAPYRRRGLAQQLIRSACGHYAASHTGKLVTLDVALINTPARQLYAKLGFIVSDLPSENGPSDVVMTIPLEKLTG